jgi:hypothetical protein
MTHNAFHANAASMDAGPIIVTTEQAGEQAGCLVGFHSQSSIGPQRFCGWLPPRRQPEQAGCRTPPHLVPGSAERPDPPAGRAAR